MDGPTGTTTGGRRAKRLQIVSDGDPASAGALDHNGDPVVSAVQPTDHRFVAVDGPALH